jgi:hypothetical protein
MRDIKTKSNKTECKDIGKVWRRNCPKCGIEIIYNYQPNFCRSRRTNSKCIYCRHDGQLLGRVQSDEEKEKRARKLRGKKRSLDSIKRYSNSKIGNKNPCFGNHSPKSIEHCRKIRLSCIKTFNKKLKKFGKKLSPTHNPYSCKLIDEYGEKHGYSFQHALNGGEFYIKELGYWVDGYDKKNNVVLEYYEKHHNRTHIKIKDQRRMREIIDYLKCTFIIMYENGNIKICT